MSWMLTVLVTRQSHACTYMQFLPAEPPLPPSNPPRYVSGVPRWSGTPSLKPLVLLENTQIGTPVHTKCNAGTSADFECLSELHHFLLMALLELQKKERQEVQATTWHQWLNTTSQGQGGATRDSNLTFVHFIHIIFVSLNCHTGKMGWRHFCFYDYSSVEYYLPNV